MFFSINSVIPPGGVDLEAYPDKTPGRWVVKLTTPDRKIQAHNYVEAGSLPEMLTPSGAVLSIIPDDRSRETWSVKLTSFDGSMTEEWAYRGTDSVLTVLGNVFQAGMAMKYLPVVRGLLKSLKDSIPA